MARRTNNDEKVLRQIYDDTTSIQSEAYQKLQVNLDYASIDKKHKIIYKNKTDYGKQTQGTDRSPLW